MLKLISVLCLSLLGASHLRAQVVTPQTDVETQTQELNRRRKSEAEVRRAAQEAQKRVLPDAGAEVTYEQVLARPDDVELNFQYARSQIGKGNLRSAAATLERVLMINPNLPKVRLMYAIVLFRLDNLEESQKELDTLKGEKMPDTLRAELNEYDKQIRKRRSRTSLGLSLSAGLDFSENQNAAPSLGQRLVADAPVTLDSNATRQNDVAKTMGAGLSLNHELGYQAGHGVYANANYSRIEQTKVRTLNLQNYSADVGAIYRSEFANITPSYEFSHLLLAETTYQRTRTAKLAFDRQLGPRFSVSGNTSYATQIYGRTQVVPTAHQRTGSKLEGSLGGGVVLTPSMKLDLTLTHTHQRALEQFNAYNREAYTLSHSWLLGRGQFLLSSFTGNLDQYELPEAAISFKRRVDHTYRARMTYGFPLGFVAKALSNGTWTFSYEYYHALSNLINYAYTNNKVSTTLTYKLDFAL